MDHRQRRPGRKTFRVFTLTSHVRKRSGRGNTRGVENAQFGTPC
jgi:hypothetical protein